VLLAFVAIAFYSFDIWVFVFELIINVCMFVCFVSILIKL